MLIIIFAIIAVIVLIIVIPIIKPLFTPSNLKHVYYKTLNLYIEAFFNETKSSALFIHCTITKQQLFFVREYEGIVICANLGNIQDLNKAAFEYLKSFDFEIVDKVKYRTFKYHIRHCDNLDRGKELLKTFFIDLPDHIYKKGYTEEALYYTKLHK